MSSSTGPAPFSGVNCASVSKKYSQMVIKLDYTEDDGNDADSCLVTDQWGQKYRLWTVLSARIESDDDMQTANLIIPKTVTDANFSKKWQAFICRNISNDPPGTGTLEEFEPSNDNRNFVRTLVNCRPEPLTGQYNISCPSLGKRFSKKARIIVDPEPKSALQSITLSNQPGEQTKLMLFYAKATVSPENPSCSVTGGADWFIQKVPDEEDFMSRARTWFQSKNGSQSDAAS